MKSFLKVLSILVISTAASVAVATPVAICKLSVCTDLVAQYRDLEQQCSNGKLKKGKAATKKKLGNVSNIYSDFSATLLKHPDDNDLVAQAQESAFELCGFPMYEAE